MTFAFPQFHLSFPTLLAYPKALKAAIERETAPTAAAEELAMAKRSLFNELMQAVDEMKTHREGKITLRSYRIDPAPLPELDSAIIRDTRAKLRCSRAVFARRLRINERTLEKWEQGRSKPNPQAAALILLVRRYPDTLDRLEKVSSR